MPTRNAMCRLLAVTLALAGAEARAEGIALLHVKSIYTDDKQAPLRDPDGVGCTDAGVLVVADSGTGRLLRYTYKDGLVGGGSEIKVPQLPYPTRIQLDGKGNLLVLDRKTRRIVRLSPSGAFVGFVEPKGASGAAVVPGAFKLDRSDNLYVQDLAGDRVLVLDASGNVTRQVAFPREAAAITDVAVDPAGVLYAVDAGKATVWAADKGAAAFKVRASGLREYLSFAGYLATGRGRLFVVDQNGHGIVVLGLDGTFQGRQLGMGWNDGLLYYPSQLCMDDAGDVFIADRANRRVQIFKSGK